MIEPDPDQPRKRFGEDEIEELAASLRSRGQKSPITVRWHPESRKYRIIDGECRYRGARLAKLRSLVGVLEEDASSSDVLVDQVIHNWQRADLSPYEIADALVRLKVDHDLSPTEIARLTGKSLGEISKLIALVEKVDPDVQTQVRTVGNASLTKRHLYALSQLPQAEQVRLAKRIVREQLTAIETERIVRAGRELSLPKSPSRTSGRPRKNLRFVTKHGDVVLRMNSPSFDDRTLLTMLHDARRQIERGDE